MYDRSEAALRRIVAKARDGGPVGRSYVELAMALMRSTPPCPLRDRTLTRLADSCDDAMPLLEKKRQSQRHPEPETSSRRQMGR